MTEPSIPALLESIQNRVDDAEAKRARSRANPDPIWDASMILAIQASSTDVPKLLAAVQAVEATCAEIDEETGSLGLNLQDDDFDRGWYGARREALDRIRSAVEAALTPDA